MKRLLAIAFILCCFASVAQGISRCNAQSDAYAKLNRPLIIRGREDAERYPALKGRATDELHAYVVAQLLTQLSVIGAQPAKLTSFLRCMQGNGPEYRNLYLFTNLPFAFTLDGDKPTVAVGFVLYRGGIAIPDLRPYLEVFQQQDGNWKDLGNVGADFEARTFFVWLLKPGKPGQHWFLIAGNRLGDTGTRLRLAIAAFDGATFREIWAMPDLAYGVLAGIRGDDVLVGGHHTNAQGRGEEFCDRYTVIPSGLKWIGRTVSPIHLPPACRQTQHWN